MKITNFGGATAIIEHNGKRILFDPWLDDGIFHGSWFHYPPLKIGLESLGHLDYVFISHIHEDHCSAGTIRHINQDAEIILIDREPNFVLRFLQAHNLHFKKIHLVKARTPVEIEPGLVVNIVEPDPSNEMTRLIDSALVIKWDNFVLYNANDCQPYGSGMQYILDTYNRVDVALLPYSGGSGYPSCYLNLTDTQKQAEKERILSSRITAFVNAVRTLQPTFTIPFADQYVIGGGRADLNQFISHPPCSGVVEPALNEAKVQTQLLLLNSGQSFDFSSKEKFPDEPYEHVTERDRDKYVEECLRDTQYDYERFTFNPSVSVDRLLRFARDRLWQTQQHLKQTPAYSFYFDVTDKNKRFWVRLDSEIIESVPMDAPLIEPYLRIAIPNNLFIMLLIGHISWNIADAALFLDYERAPNTYDPKIYALLNYVRI